MLHAVKVECSANHSRLHIGVFLALGVSVDQIKAGTCVLNRVVLLAVNFPDAAIVDVAVKQSYQILGTNVLAESANVAELLSGFSISFKRVVEGGVGFTAAPLPECDIIAGFRMLLK